jgi:hypothetical protein
MRWAGTLEMAQEGARISNPTKSRGVNIRLGIRSTRSATICSNTTE